MSFYFLPVLQRNANMQRDSMEGLPPAVGWIALTFLAILILSVAFEIRKQKNKKLH
jgi:hypothetical protein